MSRTSHSPSPHHNVRRFAGTCVAVLGAVALTVGLSAGPVSADAATQQVPLHNADAEQQQSCPDTVNDYWHFVTAPNNGSFSFVSITLDLDGTPITFNGTQIIPNGSQTDNVFVEVPGGYTLSSLDNEGSFADISPDTGSVKFVLSHLCDGTGQPTTTTTTVKPTTTTTVEETTTTVKPTTTTTVKPTTTTTVKPTTTTTAEETTTTVEQEGPATIVEATTTTMLGADGPTTTAGSPTSTVLAGQIVPTTTAVIAQVPSTPGSNPAAAQLPSTGTDNGSLMVIGTVLLVLGGVMLLGTRRPTDA